MMENIEEDPRRFINSMWRPRSTTHHDTVFGRAAVDAQGKRHCLREEKGRVLPALACLPSAGPRTAGPPPEKHRKAKALS